MTSKSKAKAKRDRARKAKQPASERKSIVRYRAAIRTEYERMKVSELDTLQASIADQFEKLYLRTQMVGSGRDFINERVDGGKVYVEVPDHVIDCHNKLARAAKDCGQCCSCTACRHEPAETRA